MSVLPLAVLTPSVAAAASLAFRVTKVSFQLVVHAYVVFMFFLFELSCCCYSFVASAGVRQRIRAIATERDPGLALQQALEADPAMAELVHTCLVQVGARAPDGRFLL
jgi:hypothetical protein